MYRLIEESTNWLTTEVKVSLWISLFGNQYVFATHKQMQNRTEGEWSDTLVDALIVSFKKVKQDIISQKKYAGTLSISKLKECERRVDGFIADLETIENPEAYNPPRDLPAALGGYTESDKIYPITSTERKLHMPPDVQILEGFIRELTSAFKVPRNRKKNMLKKLRNIVRHIEAISTELDSARAKIKAFEPVQQAEENKNVGI